MRERAHSKHIYRGYDLEGYDGNWYILKDDEIIGCVADVYDKALEWVDNHKKFAAQQAKE